MIFNAKTMACLLLSVGQAGNIIAQTLDEKKLEEVVVTGSNHATSRNLLPYSVSIVDSKQLEGTGKTQLLSALSAEIPSLFVTERNVFGFGVSKGGSGGINLRGVGGGDSGSILMMVDGQPQFSGIYSHHIADFYETEYVDHVEVLRGPGSVLYGSNAMGGVINVITKRAQQNGVHTTLTSQYGSYNTWQTSVTNMVRQGKFSSLVSLGYDRTDGTQDHFDFKQKSAYAKLGYDFSRHWTLSADYSLVNFIGNDPVYARLSQPESTDIYHQNVTRGESSLMLSDTYGQTNGCVRVYYSYGNHFIDDPRHFHSLDDRFGILAYQSFRPWRGMMSTVGFDFDNYTGKIPVSGGKAHTEGSKSTISRKSVTEYSPYVTVAQRLFHDVLVVNGGLRIANSNRFGTQWIPQVGFVVHPAEGWTIKASMAKGYRNPSFKDMYLYQMANPDLDPERMMNYEISVGKSFSRYLTAELTTYFIEGSNMIQVVDRKNQNTGSFINKGVELSFRSHPVDPLTLRASYSYLHTSLDRLTGAPKNLVFVGADWQVVPQLTLTTELKSVGSLYVSDDMAHEKYVLWNLKAAYHPTAWLQVFATLDNITDTHYVINRGYDMPGFTDMGGLKVSF